MKTLILLLASVAGLTATVGARDNHYVAQDPAKRAAPATQEESNKLDKRECYIACPSDRAFCYYPPHNYSCDRNGRFRWDERDIDCEHPTQGCYCSCDFRAPGIEQTPGSEEDKA
ncbi:hypothetical protein EsH8_I_001330 [Colletotrichum jinshuiense]